MADANVMIDTLPVCHTRVNRVFSFSFFAASFPAGTSFRFILSLYAKLSYRLSSYLRSGKAATMVEQPIVVYN